MAVYSKRIYELYEHGRVRIPVNEGDASFDEREPRIEVPVIREVPVKLTD